MLLGHVSLGDMAGLGRTHLVAQMLVPPMTHQFLQLAMQPTKCIHQTTIALQQCAPWRHCSEWELKGAGPTSRWARLSDFWRC
jgi:hypothetical protein